MTYGFDDDLNKVEVLEASGAVTYLGDTSWRGFGLLGALTIWSLSDNFAAVFGLRNGEPVTDIGAGQIVNVLIPAPRYFEGTYETVTDIMDNCQVQFSTIDGEAKKYSASLSSYLTDSSLYFVKYQDKFYVAIQVKNNNSVALNIMQDLAFTVTIIENGVGSSPTPPGPVVVEPVQS